MTKIINYFIQSILVYSAFLLSRIIGLKLSRKIFSIFFCHLGPIFKSKKIVEKNLNNFSNIVPNIDKTLITIASVSAQREPGSGGETDYQ